MSAGGPGGWRVERVEPTGVATVTVTYVLSNGERWAVQLDERVALEPVVLAVGELLDSGRGQQVDLLPAAVLAAWRDA